MFFSQPCDLSRKGDEFVDKWMSESCQLVETGPEFSTAVAQFLTWKEQFRGIAGKECFGLTLVSFNQCVSQRRY